MADKVKFKIQNEDGETFQCTINEDNEWRILGGHECLSTVISDMTELTTFINAMTTIKQLLDINGLTLFKAEEVN